MNLSDPDFWLKLALVVWNVVLTAAVWLRKPGLDAQQAVTSLREEVGSVKADMRVMTERLDHMPTHEEVAALARDMATVKADNRAQTDALERVSAQLVRIEDFLRNQR
jgi:predicted  nucleic acid-binding Zn-ribbon protein